MKRLVALGFCFSMNSVNLCHMVQVTSCERIDTCSARHITFSEQLLGYQLRMLDLKFSSYSGRKSTNTKLIDSAFGQLDLIHLQPLRRGQPLYKRTKQVNLSIILSPVCPLFGGSTALFNCFIFLHAIDPDSDNIVVVILWEIYSHAVILTISCTSLQTDKTITLHTLSLHY